MGEVIPFCRKRISELSGFDTLTADAQLIPIDDVIRTAEWAVWISAWLVVLRASGRAPTTIRTRQAHLQRVAKLLADTPPDQVTGTQLLQLVADQDWARETRRSVTASLRLFYAWAVQAGLVDDAPTKALPRVSPAPPRPRPAPEAIYRQALAAADPRVRLMLRLAAELGLRRAEIAQVHTRDLRVDAGGASLLVHGKGDRERVLPILPGLALQLRQLGPGYVFPGGDGGHLSPRWVGKLATRVLPDDWTIHTLRHRFATAAYQIDRDLLVVQQLLGHSSPATTRRYVQVDADRMRSHVRAVSNLAT